VRCGVYLLGRFGAFRSGCVWRRVTRAGDALIVHLINLVGQSDTVWDGPHRPAIALRGGTLRGNWRRRRLGLFESAHFSSKQARRHQGCNQLRPAREIIPHRPQL